MTAMELMETIGEAEEEFIEPVLVPPAKRRLSRPIRTALILAAVIAILALAGVAAKEAGLLAGLFPEKFETIEDYVNHIAVTVENDGLRLTLHEAVTDGYSVLLAYSVERLDGGSMEGMNPDIIIQPLTEDGYPTNRVGSAVVPLELENTDPTRKVYLWRAYGWKGLGGFFVRFFGLEDRETGERFSPGYLTAEVKLKPCLTKIAGTRTDAAGEKIYTDIVLSPFGLRAKVMTNISGLTEEEVTEPEKRNYNTPWTGSLELLFRDGEEQSMDVSSSADLRVDSGVQGDSLLRALFGDPVDIRSVRAVRIDGTEYPLATGPVPRERQGLWDTSASPLEQIRAWLFGDHEPAHPELTAEGTDFSLALDGVWTDGYTTELLIRIQQNTDEQIPYDRDICVPVNLGGKAAFEALDAKGNPVPAGVRYGGVVDGLMPYVVDCPEKARTLIFRFGEAVLTVPLDMKQLEKLPRITPQEPRRPSPAPETHERFLQEMYDSLFAGYAPEEVNASADNGVYRITVTDMVLRGGHGSGSLRAWAVCSALEGEYDKIWSLTSVNIREFQLYVISDGEVIPVSGGGGRSGFYDDGNQIYTIETDFRGDFDRVDALRLVWTPPAGDRITLDLEKTE